MRQICVVLLDGLGDRAYPGLGEATANEAAETPNLDRLCARGSCGLLWPLGPGRAPSSETAHWRMLGLADHEFPGRAVLEARGLSHMMGGGGPERGFVARGSSHEHPSGAVYAYAALRPAEIRDRRLWVTGRPRPDEEDAARALVERFAHLEVGELTFTLTHVRTGEAILRIDGGADDRVTDTDPFFRDRDPVLCCRPLVPEAAGTAHAVNEWTRRVHAGLAGNRLNVITVKWWGRTRSVRSFTDLHGLEGTIVASSPFLLGLAETLGMRPGVRAEEGGGPGDDLATRLEVAGQLLADGNLGGRRADQFVLVHTKALDEAGHTKDVHERVRVVEALDAAIGRLAEPPFDDVVVCVTGDHATPASPEVIHAGDPVPLVLAGPGVRADRVSRFGELTCREGILGHLRGDDLMPVLLNAADRPLFLGSRPTTVPGAAGHPYSPEPLEVP